MPAILLAFIFRCITSALKPKSLFDIALNHWMKACECLLLLWNFHW